MTLDCIECNLSYDNTYKYLEHIEKHEKHGKHEINLVKYKKLKNQSGTCYICGMKLQNYHVWKTHKEKSCPLVKMRKLWNNIKDPDSKEDFINFVIDDYKKTKEELQFNNYTKDSHNNYNNHSNNTTILDNKKKKKLSLNKEEIKSTHSHIYIHKIYNIDIEKYIFKIGMSGRKIQKRFLEYAYAAKPLLILSQDNSKVLEDRIKTELYKDETVELKFGKEYFTCLDQNKIIRIAMGEKISQIGGSQDGFKNIIKSSDKNYGSKYIYLKYKSNIYSIGYTYDSVHTLLKKDSKDYDYKIIIDVEDPERFISKVESHIIRDPHIGYYSNQRIQTDQYHLLEKIIIDIKCQEL